MQNPLEQIGTFTEKNIWDETYTLSGIKLLLIFSLTSSTNQKVLNISTLRDVSYLRYTKVAG